MIVRGILLLICLVWFCHLVGYIVCMKGRRDTKFSLYLVTGFQWIIAVFEIVALPFMLIGTKFSYLSVSVSFLILIIGILGFLYKKNNRNREEKRLSLKKYIKNHFYLFIIFCMVFIITLFSTFLYHEDDDDGYYIAISNIAVEQNRIEFANGYVYNGTEDGGSPGFQPPVVSWELFVAYLASVFHIPPVVVYHTVLPLLLIPLCFMSVYNIGRKLFKDKKKVSFLLFFYLMLNVFSGYLVRSPGCFLLLRIWQGKALLANFVFPMMIYQQIEDYEDSSEKVAWISKGMTMISGAAFSIVGIYLVPICYFVLELPYLLWLAINRNKKIWKVLKVIAVFLVPGILLGGLAFAYVISTSSGINYLNKEPTHWAVWFLVTIGTWNKGYIMLYFISVIFILYFKQKRQVFLFVLSGICLLLTFLNPLVSDFISQKVTGVDVYWRLWWILPMNITIAVAFSEVAIKLLHWKQKFFIFCSVLFIYLLGVNIYQKDLFFDSFRNLYKIPNEIIDLSNHILEKNSKPMILFAEDLSPKVRQYTSNISVPLARGMSGANSLIKETEVTYQQLYNAIYIDNDIRDSRKEEALEALQVDYIVIANKDLLLRQNGIYKKEQDFGVFRIYSKEGIPE